MAALSGHFPFDRRLRSGRSTDDGLGSKMDFVILIVRLTTGERHDLLLSGQTMLLHHGVVNMPAIHTTQAARPHLPILALRI
jgi:hypothetical protein